MMAELNKTPRKHAMIKLQEMAVLIVHKWLSSFAWQPCSPSAVFVYAPDFPFPFLSNQKFENLNICTLQILKNFANL